MSETTDTARLDWLEKHGASAECVFISHITGERHWRIDYMAGDSFRVGESEGATVREAIDAAMSKTP